MTPFTFIHAADLHLDSPFSAMGQENPDLAAAMRLATFEAFEKVIKLCIDKRVDFLLVAGDVFDGADKSLRAQVKFRDGLKRLDEVGISSFVVHGNHDPLNVWSSSLDWPSGVHLFGDRVETVEVKRDGNLLAFVQGISYPKKDERRNLSLLYKRTDPAFHIGLLHANVGADTGHEPYAPCSLEDLRKPEMDYWALGHVHKSKILSRDVPVILYPGNTQGRNIRETGEKGCYLVRVDEDGEVETEFHSTDVMRWITREVLINNLRSEQDLINALDEMCLSISGNESGRSSIARIFLTGSGPLSKALRAPHSLSDLMEVVRETGLSCSPSVWVEQIKLMISPEIALSSRMKKQDFIGELLRYSKELFEEENFEELVKDEVSLLFEDSRARRFLDLPDVRKLRDLLKKAEMNCVQGLYGEDIE
ncbi:exonuclease SbcCD subunit D [Thermodesulfobacteriota bacterium]